MKKAVVAGHICLDVIPAFENHVDLTPGRLYEVGAPTFATGGAVSNTGMTMHILGTPVLLMGKVGDDSFGEQILGILKKRQPGLEAGMAVVPGVASSYTVVVNIPGVDRIFLHCPGANMNYGCADVNWSQVKESALFHFGYPPIMKRMYENDGEELVRVMKKAKDAGAATSMDLAAVDPGSEAAKADWELILSNVLPLTDIFVPSVEELCFMLDRDKYYEIKGRAGRADFTEVLSLENDIIPLAEKCIAMGTGILLIKCGVPGMYYCTAGEERLKKISFRIELDAKEWADKKGFEKSFKPDRVLSGTGAGDTCVAAFLTSILNGRPIEKCAEYAAATGACCVTTYDALSGLKSFEELDDMLRNNFNC